MDHKKKSNFDKLSSALKNNLLRRKKVENNKNKNLSVLSKQD
jgi:hypothetical protein